MESGNRYYLSTPEGQYRLTRAVTFSQARAEAIQSGARNGVDVVLLSSAQGVMGRFSAQQCKREQMQLAAPCPL